MPWFRIFLSYFIINIISADHDADLQNPRVQLKNGLTIVGTSEQTFDQEKTYYSFRGIPFAKPPVGELRFRPPVPLTDEFYNQTINGFTDGPHCFELSVSMFFSGSEDCLYLNVYTPQFPKQNSSLLPVMVWIYGGAFVSGDGSYSTFGPDFFLNEGNVMIVTFNHREGIFGFLSTGDEAAPGNYGLHDQILALKWVQEHIRYFGGNPEQVTLFGESSGAVSVSYLTQTPLAKGLFHRAILQSGTSLNSWALTRNPHFSNLFADLVLKLSGYRVDRTNTNTFVDSLRKVHSAWLYLFQNAWFLLTMLGSSQHGLPYGPTIEPQYPDAIVVNKSHEQLNNGLFHQVPYIIGFNSLESKSIVDAVSLPTVIHSVLDGLPSISESIIHYLFKFIKPYIEFDLAVIGCLLHNLLSILKSNLLYIFKFIRPHIDFNAGIPLLRFALSLSPRISVTPSLNVNQSNLFEVGSTIASHYSDFQDNHLHEFFSEDQFNRPILEAARLYSQKAPVYLYRFSYEGTLPSNDRRSSIKGVGHGDESSLPSNVRRLVGGVGHGDEVFYMWRWRKSYDQQILTPSDLLTQKRLIKLWTNFAITGNPTPDDDPLLQNVKWERANKNGNLTYLDIGQNLSPGVNYDSKQFKFWNKLFNIYGNPPYSTY